jgi:glycosyltransferase involved in cell wall biosynthesis
MIHSENQTTPFVTVIMPVRNEAAHIEGSLDAVLTQNYPQDYLEVIVTDGISSDGTRDIIRALQCKYSFLRLIDNPGKTVSIGFNLALRQARGDIIIRVDGHTEIAPDYIHQCVAELQRSGADNVGGNMTVVATTTFGQAVALATSSPLVSAEPAFIIQIKRSGLIQFTWGRGHEECLNRSDFSMKR